MILWQYFHDHWQDNLLAGFLQSVIVFTIAWFWKIKPHFKKLHRHNEYIALRTEQLHKHFKVKHGNS